MYNSRKQIYKAIADNTLDVEQALDRLKEIHGRPASAVERIFAYEDILLRDHQLFDRRVVMGMVHLSLAVDAGQRMTSENRLVGLENISFQKAVVLEAGERAALSVEIENGNGMPTFRTVARKPDGPAVYSATGRMVFAKPSPSPAPDEDFRQWRKSPGKAISAEYFYENQHIYGPSFHSLKEVSALGDVHMGRYELTPAIREELDEYGVHPAIFDIACANSVIAAANGNPEKIWVPLHIRSIELRDRCPAAGYCGTRMRNSNREVMVSDHALYDPDGRCVLRMEGLRLKHLASAGGLGTRRSTATNLPGAAALSERTETITETASEPGMDTRFHAAPRTDIAAYLEAHLKRALDKPPARLPRNKNFMDLGIDSTRLIGIATDIERDLGIELYPTLFFEYQNIEALSGYFLEAHTDAVTAFLPGGSSEVVSLDGKDGASSGGQPRLKVVRTGNGPGENRKPVKAIRDRDIAVVGMAGRFAGAADTGQFWRNLIEGRDLVEEIPGTRFDPAPWFDEDPGVPHKTYSRWGSFIDRVDRFDPLFFEISPEEAVWLDPQTRLLLEVIYETMEDAGYGPRLFGTNTGLFIGSCFHEYWDELVRRGIPITDHQYNSNGPSCMSGRISYTFDFRGESIPLDNACASSLTAIHLAVRALRGGECDMAFAAGSNLLLSPLHYICFSKLQMLSPTGRSRSFGKDADGYVPGEGVGALLLKPLGKAIEDNDNIHAVIKGSATNHVGRANSPVAPRMSQQAEVLQRAWQDAAIDPGTISYIETQGVGSLLGDAVEVNGMVNAFAPHTDKRNFCAIGSLKPNLGHLEGAAGVAGVIKVILSMKHGKIPVMPHLGDLNPYIKLTDTPLFINPEVADWPGEAEHPMRSGVSAFGMTGNNTHIVIESHPPETAAAPDDAENLLFTLSARDRDRLKEYAARLADFIENLQPNPSSGNGRPAPSLADVAYTLRMSRSFWEERLALVAGSLEALVSGLWDFSRHGAEAADIFTGTVENPFETGGHAPGPHPAEESDPAAQARFWIRGGRIDQVPMASRGRRPRLVSLPTYPFGGGRYWMPRNPASRPVAAAAAAPPHDPREGTLASYLMEVVADALRLDGLPLNPDTSLRKYGLNSLAGMRILNRLQDRYGAKIPPSIFFECATINEMAAYLTEAGYLRRETVRDRNPTAPASSEHPRDAAKSDLAQELLRRVQRGDLAPGRAAELGAMLFQDIAGSIPADRIHS